MANNTVVRVYREVIDDVINNVRGDFEDMGIDESVLAELQKFWEDKMQNSRVMPGDVPYDTEEGEPEFSQQAAHSYVSPSNDQATAAATLSMMATTGVPMKPDPDVPYNGVGKPQSFLSPVPIPGAGRPNIPQTDGSDDLTKDEIDALIEKAILQARSRDDVGSSSSELTLEFDLPRVSLATARRALLRHGVGHQVDGNNDEEDDDTINSDLDDPDEDEGNQDSGEDSNGDIILCLYDKVTRHKNKWKCVLKDGIMSINGHDYVFQKANGDFEW